MFVKNKPEDLLYSKAMKYMNYDKHKLDILNIFNKIFIGNKIEINNDCYFFGQYLLKIKLLRWFTRLKIVQFDDF